MRSILIALTVICLSLVASTSYAQCPGGVCPTGRVFNAGPLAATSLRGTTTIRSRSVMNYGDGMVGVGSTARRERRRGFFFRRR
jgi:hypothetical protein